MKLRLREPQARFSRQHNPDPSHQDTDEAADHLHQRVECTTHRAPRDKKVCVHLLQEHIEKLLNSGLLSMLMRLAYIGVGVSPNRQLDVRQCSTNNCRLPGNTSIITRST